MRIQNSITMINVSEKIDLADQLRHFLAIFESLAARWDLHFDEKSQEIKVKRVS